MNEALSASLASIPATLRLRVIAVQPNLTLTEVHLVDGALLYERIHDREHVPTEVRAARPFLSNWADLSLALDQAGFWLWPRRWPRVHDGFMGEFAIVVEWAGHAAVSAGPIGVAPVVDDVIAAAERLVGGPLAQCPPQGTSAHRTPAPQPPYRSIAFRAADVA